MIRPVTQAAEVAVKSAVSSGVATLALEDMGSMRSSAPKLIIAKKLSTII